MARQADMHTRRGFELAGRGAYFSARAQLVMALRILAQALDDEEETDVHSGALAAGLTAIEEAGDFIPTGSALEAQLDVPDLVRFHRTPVLKNARGETLAPLTALRTYFTFAQQQLATAAGTEVAASMALHGLGNLHRALAARGGNAVRAAVPKAMVFYQAALLVDPQNHMASNELGVLLARAGRYEEARAALEHSVSVCSQSAGWHNLALVYGWLGRSDMAQHASRQSQAALQAEVARGPSRGPTSAGQVRWVDPWALARSDSAASDAEHGMPCLPWSSQSMPSQPWAAAARDVAQSPPWDSQDKRN